MTPRAPPSKTKGPLLNSDKTDNRNGMLAVLALIGGGVGLALLTLSGFPVGPYLMPTLIAAFAVLGAWRAVELARRRAGPWVIGEHVGRVCTGIATILIAGGLFGMERTPLMRLAVITLLAVGGLGLAAPLIRWLIGKLTRQQLSAE